MLGHVRVEGTLGHEVQESGERPSRDTLAPMLLADPVADEADTVLGPAPDVARDLVVEEDRPIDRRRVAEDVCGPMGVEGCAVAGGESGHARGVGVELLLVEDREVVPLDVAESYFVAQVTPPGRGLSVDLSLRLAMYESRQRPECRIMMAFSCGVRSAFGHATAASHCVLAQVGS